APSAGRRRLAAAAWQPRRSAPPARADHPLRHPSQPERSRPRGHSPHGDAAPESVPPPPPRRRPLGRDRISLRPSPPHPLRRSPPLRPGRPPPAQFIEEDHLRRLGAPSYQRLLDLAERLETIEAVKEGLASVDRGEGRPMGAGGANRSGIHSRLGHLVGTWRHLAGCSSSGRGSLIVAAFLRLCLPIQAN